MPTQEDSWAGTLLALVYGCADGRLPGSVDQGTVNLHTASELTNLVRNH